MKFQVEPGILTRIRWLARKAYAKPNEVPSVGRFKLNLNPYEQNIASVTFRVQVFL